VLAILASTDIAVQTIKRTAAVWIDGIVIQKPGIPAPGFVEDCFGEDLLWQL